MSWGSKTQIATNLSVSSSELYSNAVTLNPGESAHAEVEADFPASPTDELTVKLYGTLDDSSENWDDTPMWTQNIANSPDPDKIAIPVSGLYKFRFGFARDGSTDTITVNAWVRKDGVNL